MRLAATLPLALATTLAATPVAQACSCDDSYTLLWPELDATGVPVNARVWASEYGLDPYFLRVVGAPLEMSLSYSTSRIDTVEGPLEVLTPDELLAPNTSYELLVCSEDIEVVCNVIGRFTTGADEDRDPPPLPIETDRDGDADAIGRYCGKSKSVTLEVAAEGLLVVQIDEGSLDPLSLSGATTFVTREGSVQVGEGGCLRGWPGSSKTASLRYGAFDLAGNFSGWTDSDTLQIGNCQCRSDAPVAPAFFTLSVASLAFCRRRRRG